VDDQATPGPRPDRLGTLARVLGELLVTAGLVLLLFVVYEVYVTDLATDRRQDELADELHDEWERNAPAPRESLVGDAFAVLHIPRFGPDYQQVVLEGTAGQELSKGPGHYAGTAFPGEPGNMALAGHRVGKGSPFLELDTMLPGEPIVVETRDSWFVYRVLGDRGTGAFTGDPSGIPGMQIVGPGDIEVISPTPNATADVPPSGAYLTLTTCHPRYSARQRLIIHAVLEGGGIPKADAPDGPPALRER
jgi:sortase A